MAREIKVKVKKNLRITDGKVKRVFETSAKKCGNGAIVYVPKENIKDKFYVVVVKDDKNDSESTNSKNKTTKKSSKSRGARR